MSRPVTVACVQVNAGTEILPNLENAGMLARRARDIGATFITFPENVGAMVHGRAGIVARAFPEAEHPGVAYFAELARELGAWLLAGSLHVRLDNDDDGSGDNAPVANRSILFDETGRIVARYDKIHMFDVDLAGGESYRESATFRPGAEAVLVKAPFANIGMTICYDVRFPHLHRTLAQAGAEILTGPAAFTVPTGRAHWHVLLRARAIETGCFVVAAAQVGTHDKGRQTYGHSLIISPWGEVLADGGEEVGFVTAELDLDKVAEARSMVPALRHDRPFTVKTVDC